MARIQYFYIALAGILFALFVRKGLWQYLPYSINIWIGDFLWAVMLYFAFTALFYRVNTTLRVILLLVICCGVEISQDYHTEWLDAFRHTTFGGLLLGHGFLWSDIFANIAGVLLAAAFDATVLNKNKNA